MVADKMNELVRRADVQDEIDRWLDSVGTILIGKGLSSYGELIGCLEDAPAANRASVRLGWWESVDSAYWRWTPAGGVTVSHITYRCSRCWRGSAVKTPYCPGCGAKMDGGAENG